MGRVLSESSTVGAVGQRAAGYAFWWRFTDNLFRRLPWFLIPVIAMTIVGLTQASSTTQVFYSSATLSASTNPLVPDQPIGGLAAQGWESPAAATSRLINERLRTNAFVEAVAERADLGVAVESGALDLAVVRSGVWASEEGDSILSVSASTSNPQVSYDLVVATIAEFREFVMDRAASDYSEAESFWTQQLQTLKNEQDSARRNLTEFAASLPELEEGETRSLDDQLRMQSLNSDLDTINAKIASAETAIDQAQLAKTQQSTEASDVLEVIDVPEVSQAPQSSLAKRVMIVASWLLLGAVISVAALFVTTMLDHTVASAADLLALDGVSLVASVPPVRFGQAQPRQRVGFARRKTGSTTRSGRS